jgi:AcrR family transcriptional regulator
MTAQPAAGPRPAPRPQRKDAARNHELLLEAGREVFAERGLNASLDEIAHRAGLGVGTAYRHFANKQEVAEALFEQAIEKIVGEAERALSIEDPWEAFVSFFHAAATSQAKDRGLHEVLVGVYPTERLDRVRDQLVGAIDELFARAQKAGVLRADAVPTDAGVLFAMLGVVYDMSSKTAPELWCRYFALILDGLRATDAAPMPGPALTTDELETAMARVKLRPPTEHGPTPVAG